jgi:hypothetical protein
MIANICSLCRVPCHEWAGTNEAEFKAWWCTQIGRWEFEAIEYYSRKAEKMTIELYETLITAYRGSI